MKKPSSLQMILDTASLSGRHVAGLRVDFRSRLNAFRRHRSAEEQQALTENFRQVLAAWGIADAGIPGVITALRLRLLVFAVPAAICAIAAFLLRDFTSCLSLICIAPPCLFGMATTLWRISILKTRHFLPLCRWLPRFRKRP